MWSLHGFIWRADAERARRAAGRGAVVVPLKAGSAVSALARPADHTAEAAPNVEGLVDDAAVAAAMARRHHETLTWLAAVIDVLPARLGQCAPTAQALAESAAARADGLAQRLETVRGAAEFTARICEAKGLRGARAPAAATTSGAAYLRERLAARRGAESATADRAAMIERLEAAFDGFARDRVAQLGPTPHRPTRVYEAALLIPRGLEGRLAMLGAETGASLARAGLQLDLIGPSAPFSFAVEADDADRADAEGRAA